MLARKLGIFGPPRRIRRNDAVHDPLEISVQARMGRGCYVRHLQTSRVQELRADGLHNAESALVFLTLQVCFVRVLILGRDI